MAIEMVYVPQGSFYVGSGGTDDGMFFTYPNITNPYYITSEAAITVGTTDGNLFYSIGSGFTGDQFGPIPAAFPKGHNDFYCMKYEITQNQYVTFINKLTYAQQETRTAVPPNSAAGTLALVTGINFRNGIVIMTPGTAGSTPSVYGCNLDGDSNYDEPVDGQSLACNYLSWADVAAYLDWSALRPITELEYEKAGRGKKTPVADEYAWGSTMITDAISITNSGENNEIAQAGANCSYGGDNILGPLRAGIFAQVTTNREQAGSSYYGIMELTGNLTERPVTVGNTAGRSFTSTNGNGVLEISGNANASNWPAPSATGASLRGGSWEDGTAYLRLSGRYYGALVSSVRAPSYGGRGCRIAP